MLAGAKKPLDVEINLVPFIDLMAVTIAFLLITAVWTQTGAQPVATAGRGEGAATETLDVTVTEREVQLGGRTVSLPELEAALRDQTARTATLRVDDGVRHETMVHVIDACRGANVDVAVSPAAD